MQILTTSLNIKYVQVQYCSCSTVAFREKNQYAYTDDYQIVKKELESYIIAAKIVRVRNNYI